MVFLTPSPCCCDILQSAVSVVVVVPVPEIGMDLEALIVAVAKSDLHSLRAESGRWRRSVASRC